jgi:hypothetical protein
MLPGTETEDSGAGVRRGEFVSIHVPLFDLEYETGTWHESGMPLIDFGERDVDKWTLRTVVERGCGATKWWT